MREILFKAKRIDNGKWVEGYYCKWLKGERIITYSEKETDCIITWMSNGGMSRYEVDPETICQFTGLLDKNGNKIWENDIVKYEDAEADFEGYHDNVFVNVGKVCITPQGVFFTNRQTVDMDDLWLSDCSVEAEVIGSAIDNPELLKGGNNE